MAHTLLVNRTDFKDTQIVDTPNADLGTGDIRVKIGPWALTSNNITYMVVGDQIGYWKFFEPADYNIDKSGFGRMPVWGYAEVTESRVDDIKVGTTLYGFFPISDTLDMTPVKMSRLGFQDGRAHRTALHPVYNSYTFVDADPSFAGVRELQPILRPLFTTSFLIDDFLAQESFFGAEQVILLSASSKTALGTAFCLKQRGGVRVTGLTSDGNMDFVKSTGFYDEVQSYDAITDLNPDVKTAVVDMAGNGKIMATVYDHFEENIVYNCMVGKSHWESGTPPKPAKGAPAIMFFAPDRARQRMSDWGPEGFAKELGVRWVPFCQSAADWLSVESANGSEAILETYHDFLDGKASPTKGYLFTL